MNDSYAETIMRIMRERIDLQAIPAGVGIDVYELDPMTLQVGSSLFDIDQNGHVREAIAVEVTE